MDVCLLCLLFMPAALVFFCHPIDYPRPLSSRPTPAKAGGVEGSDLLIDSWDPSLRSG